MNNDEVEYDPQELERLIAEALGELETSGSRALFSFSDSKLLEHLNTILPNYVQTRGEVTVVLDELRERLYEDLDRHQDQTASLRSLHTAVKHCRACPKMQPDPHLPHWNLTDPDVVFVTDTPLSGSPGDQHLIDSLKEAGFRSNRIAATSVVRCFPEERRTVDPQEVARCTSRYLFTELTLLRPRMVVAVGGLATGVLIGESELKITEERGKVFWIGPWPVLATITPAYALRSERAKEHLAHDLQSAYHFVYGK